MDKTYNLGSIFATVLVYKNLSLVKTDTQAHPLFVGPIYLHINSTNATYSKFFNHLRSKIPDSLDFLFGSDDEAAIHQAFSSLFPEAHHILCFNHLKQNVTKYLTDKVGLNQTTRKHCSDAIFNTLDATDDAEFKESMNQAVKICEEDCSSFVPYLQNRLFPNLKTKVWPYYQKFGSKWTNNNSESVNLVLKTISEWKKQSVPKLIEIIYELVKSMQNDVERAIMGCGPYILHSHFKSFQTLSIKWKMLSVGEKKKYIKRFYNHMPHLQKQTSISSDLRFITKVPSSKSGKKPTGKRKNH